MNYEKKFGDNILIGNNALCKTVWIGSIQIIMHDEIVRTLNNVCHVPNFKKNLISLEAINLC